MHVGIHQGSNFAVEDYPHGSTGHFACVTAVDKGATASMFFRDIDEIDALIEAANEARSLLAIDHVHGSVAA